MTTSSSPLASVKSATSGPAASEGVAIAVASAISARFVLRSTFLGLNMLRSCVNTKSGDVAHHQAKLDLQSRTLLHRLGMSCVVVRRLRLRVFADTVRLIRRRRLVPRRRIGQRIARRLTGEFRRFLFLAVKHVAEHAVPEAEFRRHDLAAEAGCRRLVAIVGLRRLFLWLATGRQLIGTQRILFALTFIADVATLLRRRLRLAPFDVGVFRPRWVVGDRGAALLRRRERAAGRNDERRTLPVVDRLLAVTTEAEPFHDATQEFLIGRQVVIGRMRGSGTKQRSRTKYQAE